MDFERETVPARPGTPCRRRRQVKPSIERDTLYHAVTRTEDTFTVAV
jgi:hypothetical protein